MKRLLSDQQGVGFLAVLAVLVILGAVAFAGIRVMDRNQATSSASPVSFTHGVPASIKTSDDLTKASAALDSTAIDSSVNPDSLDGDLNSLL